jgi:CubicO group peptidase (beta-lactamase class C family)
MALDSIFWIASCTKMIVGIASMQLVEKGLPALDYVGQVATLCPELRDVKVSQDNGELVEKKRGMTLRMLLSYTAGFGYTFFNEKLRDFSKPVGYDEFSGLAYDVLQPLVNQLGEGWKYGINIGWAGALVELATHSTLDEYGQSYIHKPLGLRTFR